MSTLFEFVEKDAVRKHTQQNKKIFAGKYFDAHVHIFSYKDVPDGFIGIRLPWTKQFMYFMSRFLDLLVFWKKNDKLSKISKFIDIFSLDQRTIFWMLKKTYANSAAINENSVAYLTICMDMQNSVKGELKRPFIEQTQEVYSIMHENPGKLLFFSQIDANSIDKRALAKVISDYGCSGIKLYPSLGYTAKHPELYDIYRFCECTQLPIMIHSSSASTKTTKHVIKVKELQDNNKVKSQLKLFLLRESYRKFFNDPAKTENIIKTFPTLKICFAHFGGFTEWRKKLRGKRSWADTIIRLIEENDNVYTDISYTLFDTRITEAICEEALKSKRLRARILYGSDFYMTFNDSTDMSKLLADNISIIESYDLLEDFMRANVHRYLFEPPVE